MWHLEMFLCEFKAALKNKLTKTFQERLQQTTNNKRRNVRKFCLEYNQTQIKQENLSKVHLLFACRKSNAYKLTFKWLWPSDDFDFFMTLTLLAFWAIKAKLNWCSRSRMNIYNMWPWHWTTKERGDNNNIYMTTTIFRKSL